MKGKPRGKSDLSEDNAAKKGALPVLYECVFGFIVKICKRGPVESHPCVSRAHSPHNDRN